MAESLVHRVKCIGIDGHGMEFAHGHCTYRVVALADKDLVIRCEACQKEFNIRYWDEKYNKEGR